MTAPPRLGDGWRRLWRHSYRLGARWVVRDARSGWRAGRVGWVRLLVPLDPWRYYECGRVADQTFTGACLDVSSPKLLTSLLQHEGNGTWVGTDLFSREIERVASDRPCAAARGRGCHRARLRRREPSTTSSASPSSSTSVRVGTPSRSVRCGGSSSPAASCTSRPTSPSNHATSTSTTRCTARPAAARRAGSSSNETTASTRSTRSSRRSPGASDCASTSCSDARGSSDGSTAAPVVLPARTPPAVGVPPQLPQLQHARRPGRLGPRRGLRPAAEAGDGRWLSERALVIGCAGQDGSYLCELLVSRGYEVLGVTRPASDPRCPTWSRFEDRIEVVRGGPGRYTQPSPGSSNVRARRDLQLRLGVVRPGRLDDPARTTELGTLALAGLVEEVRRRGPRRGCSRPRRPGCSAGPPSLLRTSPPHCPVGAVRRGEGVRQPPAPRLPGALRGPRCSGIFFNHESPRGRPSS